MQQEHRQELKRSAGRYMLTWLALIVLLAATCASAFIHLGTWNGALNLAIAALKAALVAIVFMRAAGSGPLIRIVALAALFALALMFSLGGADYMTRRLYRAPWQTPQQILPLAAPGPT